MAITTSGGRRPTLHDVAAQAGVSIKSVSRVLNGEPGLSPANRVKVEDAIRALGYRRNDTAHLLRRADGRTACLGLVLEDVGNPFAGAVHRAVEEIAGSQGSLVLAVSTQAHPEREERLIRRLLSRDVDGLIVMSSRPEHSYLSDIIASTPLVFIDRAPVGVVAMSVLSDNRRGACQAVAQLLRLGHRRVAFLGDRRGLYTTVERYAGYLQAHRSASLDTDPQLHCDDLGDGHGAEIGVAKLLALDEPPTALFAANNIICVGALTALNRHGQLGHIAVVGFDDIDLATVIDPALTVVRQDPDAMGRIAAEMIFQRLSDIEPDDAQVTIGVELVPRGSGELPGPYAR